MIVAFSPPAVLAAKTATTQIPIIFVAGVDPVKSGWASSLNRPGGNMTGISTFTTIVEEKKLEIIGELVPNPAVIAIITNASNPNVETTIKGLQAAAQTLSREVQILNASTGNDIDAAFTKIVRQKAGGLVVAADPLFFVQRDQIVTLAAHHAIPAIYEYREFSAAGGLMSYGTSLPGVYNQAGALVARILKGEKPSDLPIMQPTKFDFVINLKTAKALGLELPLPLLGRVDEVIE